MADARSNTRWGYLVLVIAFLLRVRHLDLYTAYFDHAMPHGLGIAILDSIAQGQWRNLPVLGIPSSAVLANPIGASYFWAIVALFNRDPYLAAFISILLNVLAVAMVFDLGRRLCGPAAGPIAAFIMAISPWSIYFAQGTWLQGQLEFASIGTAWFLFTAFKANNKKRLFAGMVFLALMLQTYLAALLLLAPVLAASVVFLSQRQSRPLRKTFWVGLGVCGMSLMAFAGIALSQSDIPNLGALRPSETSLQSPLPASFGLAVQRTFQNISGHGFGTQLAQATLSVPSWFLGAQFFLLTAMLIGGLVMLCIQLCRAQRQPMQLALLAWWAVPVLLLTALPPDQFLKNSSHYLLIAHPVGYLLTALPLASLLQRTTRPALRVLIVGSVALVGLAFVISTGSLLNAHAQNQVQTGYSHQVISFEEITHYPLRVQRQIAQQWRNTCTEVVAEGSAALLFSIYQSSTQVREQALRVALTDEAENSIVWQIGPGGGTCATRIGPSAPPFAQANVQPMPGGTTLTTYHSNPITEQSLRQSLALTAVAPLNLNLGWCLLGLASPPRVQPGQPITLSHAWRIESLPDEPYQSWRYELFVKLLSPDGTRNDLADHLPLPAAAVWRRGDYVVGDIYITLPTALAPGRYAFEVSIFDATQKKNAVFFDPKSPGQPIVVLLQEVQVLP